MMKEIEEMSGSGYCSTNWAEFCYWPAFSLMIVSFFQIQFMCIYWKKTSSNLTIATNCLGRLFLRYNFIYLQAFCRFHSGLQFISVHSFIQLR